MTGTVLEQCNEVRADPAHAVDLARVGVRGTTALGSAAPPLAGPQDDFQGSIKVPKRAAWSAPIPLQDIKLIGGELGGTVNESCSRP